MNIENGCGDSGLPSSHKVAVFAVWLQCFRKNIRNVLRVADVSHDSVGGWFLSSVSGSPFSVGSGAVVFCLRNTNSLLMR